MKFTAFLKWLGVELTPAQRVLCAVAFDGIDPIDLDAEDRALAVRLFGPVDRIPASARKVLVAVCGARGGKTYILIALRLLHLALTVDLSHLAPGELAAAIVVAPDLRLARQGIRYVRGAVEANADLRPMVCKDADSVDGFTIDRGQGRKVSIECLAASRGGSATRGRSLVGAGLDEAAFFRDANAVVNDVDVYKSVAPRIMPGGQLVIASTPWAELGLLHELFSGNHGNPQIALAAHAPTSLLREGHQHILDEIARERIRDPENASREFDAEFMAAGSGLFFDPATIDAATEVDFVDGDTGEVGIGGDFAFVSDSSALAVAKRRGRLYDCAELIELRPKRGQPLVPSAVVETFATKMLAHGVRSMLADLHYLESVREHLAAHKCHATAAPAGQDGKAETYLFLRRLLAERRIRLPKHARLLQQLKAIISKPTPGGGLRIIAPRRGGHGDLVSALVLAVWAATDFDDPAMRRAEVRGHREVSTCGGPFGERPDNIRVEGANVYIGRPVRSRRRSEANGRGGF